MTFLSAAASDGAAPVISGAPGCMIVPLLVWHPRYLADVAALAWASQPTGYPPAYAGATPEELGAWLETSGDVDIRWVAVTADTDAVVGHVQVELPSPAGVAAAGGVRPDAVRVVAKLFVADSHRRQGLGAHLVNCAYDWAQQHGYTLTAAASQASLFVSAGWEAVGDAWWRAPFEPAGESC